KRGEEEEAEKFLREALALDPGFTEAAIALNSIFFKQEKYDQVIDLLSTIEIQEESEPQFLWDAALAYQQLEEYSKALTKYESAYNFFKNDEAFLTNFGYFLIEEGKNDRAAEIFKQLLKSDPTN